MRVLLVDDEEELVSALAERLSIRGIKADWVTSGEDALKRIQSETYDLALLDVKLPRMSGLKLKKLLQEKNPELKFIFFTGHGSENDFKVGSAEAGAQYYLAKPVNIEVLVQKMNEVLEK
ncbi:MAG: response regulator [Deltaproteobacteria bacterium]|nr:response regulator [Deltaproteobacteria bacterium]MBW2085808.1 response regulator [Deltaproteobacteria bacterium]